MMNETKITSIFQHGTRLFILALVTYFAVLHRLQGKLGAPNAHVFCPFGGLESLYKWLAGGEYIQKIYPATMILFFGVLLLTLVLNRAFCGWICPLGTLQSLFYKIGRFLKIKKVQVPPNVEKYLSAIKYIILVVVIYFTWRIGDLVYAPYDPWAAYTHIGAGFQELYDEFLIGSIFLLVAVIGSLWLPNNFCRYFCPMGAFLSLIAKLSPSKIHRNQTTCVACKKCDEVCPVQIDVCAQPTVSSSQCLACGDCIAVCPEENCLQYRIGGKIRLRWLVYGIAAVVLFFTPVFAAKQAKLWKTDVDAAMEALRDDSGVLNPYNIKGSMTLEQTARIFTVPMKMYIEKFHLPEDIDEHSKLKALRETYGIRPKDIAEVTMEYLKQQNPGQILEKPASREGH